MSRETLKYLYDVHAAAERIFRFTRDRTWPAYRDDELLRSAVERQFEIIGEALNQLSRRQPDVTERIDGCRRAIAFRNILIHGYAEIDAEIVWRVIVDDLPALHRDVTALMADDPSSR